MNDWFDAAKAYDLVFIKEKAAECAGATDEGGRTALMYLCMSPNVDMNIKEMAHLLRLELGRKSCMGKTALTYLIHNIMNRIIVQETMVETYDPGSDNFFVDTTVVGRPTIECAHALTQQSYDTFSTAGNNTASQGSASKGFADDSEIGSFVGGDPICVDIIGGPSASLAEKPLQNLVNLEYKHIMKLFRAELNMVDTDNYYPITHCLFSEGIKYIERSVNLEYRTSVSQRLIEALVDLDCTSTANSHGAIAAKYNPLVLAFLKEEYFDIYQRYIDALDRNTDNSLIATGSSGNDLDFSGLLSTISTVKRRYDCAESCCFFLARIGHRSFFENLLQTLSSSNLFCLLNGRTCAGENILMLAAENGHASIIKLIQQSTLACDLAAHGNVFLANFRADVRSYSTPSLSQLERSAVEGEVEALGTEQSGVATHSISNPGFTVAENGLLIYHDKAGMTSLMRAAKFGHVGSVHLLLHEACHKDHDGWTAIVFCIRAERHRYTGNIRSYIRIIHALAEERDTLMPFDNSYCIRFCLHNNPSCCGYLVTEAVIQNDLGYCFDETTSNYLANRDSSYTGTNYAEQFANHPHREMLLHDFVALLKRKYTNVVLTDILIQYPTLYERYIEEIRGSIKLLSAARMNNRAYILKCAPIQLGASNPETGRTALMTACEKGFFNLIDLLKDEAGLSDRRFKSALIIVLDTYMFSLMLQNLDFEPEDVLRICNVQINDLNYLKHITTEHRDTNVVDYLECFSRLLRLENDVKTAFDHYAINRILKYSLDLREHLYDESIVEQQTISSLAMVDSETSLQEYGDRAGAVFSYNRQLPNSVAMTVYLGQPQEYGDTEGGVRSSGPPISPVLKVCLRNELEKLTDMIVNEDLSRSTKLTAKYTQEVLDQFKLAYGISKYDAFVGTLRKVCEYEETILNNSLIVSTVDSRIGQLYRNGHGWIVDTCKIWPQIDLFRSTEQSFYNEIAAALHSSAVLIEHFDDECVISWRGAVDSHLQSVCNFFENTHAKSCRELTQEFSRLADHYNITVSILLNALLLSESKYDTVASITGILMPSTSVRIAVR